MLRPLKPDTQSSPQGSYNHRYLWLQPIATVWPRFFDSTLQQLLHQEWCVCKRIKKISNYFNPPFLGSAGSTAHSQPTVGGGNQKIGVSRYLKRRPAIMPESNKENIFVNKLRSKK